MPGTLQDFAQAVHNVISINRDAEQGFRGAAQAVNDPTLKQMFEQYSAQRAQFAVELQAAVRAMGFDATDPQGLGGMLHASWTSLKGMVTGHNVHGILVETERAEDWSLQTYRAALGKTLPPEIASIMQDSSRKCKRPTIASRLCATPLRPRPMSLRRTRPLHLPVCRIPMRRAVDFAQCADNGHVNMAT
jgi:uncharacterized protein (TIGR02284 family)